MGAGERAAIVEPEQQLVELPFGAQFDLLHFR
jgi:hypothetical protein